MTKDEGSHIPRDIVVKIRRSFFMYPDMEFVEPLIAYAEGDSPYAKCVASAIENFHSTISAVSLPFTLMHTAIIKRRFDSIHASERILALIPEKQGAPYTTEMSKKALEKATQKANEFFGTEEGKNYVRDHIVYEMHDSLKSPNVENGSQELLVQTLISTWSIFESFSRSFIISWLDEHPNDVSLLMASSDFKDYFGKQIIDIQTIGDHSFDLSRSMGTILFKNRRLDSLSNIKNAMKALFNSADLQNALGTELRTLNQKRHLFVHNRGVVDAEYIKKTDCTSPLGERLKLDAHEINDYMIAVRAAIMTIGDTVRALK
ncbi:hypothetical protein K7H22_13725 [Seohaeicola saemankumensis]|uniref:hypothetical protein n=1 Tax=Seohaeicola saemankumensis TaxID=481181 RepID=UPI001E4FA4AF|nr:hypothetical protein [Seohaeicola saemankumensis]MCD1627056.1 hypothetical protein [Seohaeicola saemankumensis]